MGRWTDLDSDSYRLPEGMTRIGYDADTQRYTFKDTDGSLWVSAPGSEYGRLTRVAESDSGHMSSNNEQSNHLLGFDGQHDEQWRFAHLDVDHLAVDRDVRSSWKMLAPFLLLVCLVPVLVWRFLGMGTGSGHDIVERNCRIDHAQAVIIEQGDTCWDLARKYEMSLDELVKLNKGLACESLSIGDVLCVKSDIAE